MNRWIRYPLVLSGICAAICLPRPAVAGPNVGTVMCPVNEDRVWVYDSLTSFDVAAKLRCGETVEIVSRVKGYVKVRIPSGVVGYLPDSAFPDLPPLSDDQEKLGDHNAAPVETAVVTDGAPMSLAAAAAAYRASHKRTPEPVPVVASSPAPVTEEAVAVSAPKPVAAPPAEAPRMVASVAASIPAPSSTAPRVVSSAASPIVIESEPEAAPVPAPRRAAAVVASAKTARPAIASRPSAPVPSVAPPAPEVAADVVAAAPVARVDDPPIPAPATMPVMVAANAAMREVPTARPAAIVPESDEYPDTQPENASADPNCRVFFSAYGLGAEQYKWLSESRQKQFSGICPAPNLASVDFVILFTHDTDSYITAMPAPVHTDGNGFSDFDPMTTVDTALMSPTEADKAHYELAWVFRVTRGAFDPARFSPRRRPQYQSTAKGAHASTKAVEDAFDFIQQQGSTR